MISPEEIAARQREIPRNNHSSFSVFARRSDAPFSFFCIARGGTRREKRRVRVRRREEMRKAGGGKKEGERKRTNNEALFATEKLVETGITPHTTM